MDSLVIDDNDNSDDNNNNIYNDINDCNARHRDTDSDECQQR